MLERTNNLADLAEWIRAEHVQAQEAMRSGLAHALKCGQLLTQAKALVKHGDWLPWLAANCDIPERTAQAYMRIANNWDSIEKNASIADLTFSGALKLLAASSDKELDIDVFSAWAARAEKRLESADLQECVSIIQEASSWQNGWAEYALGARREAGAILQALEEIREQKLYRGDYATFEDYCLGRWGHKDLAEVINSLNA